MTTSLKLNDTFPDWTLPNHENHPITLSNLTAPSSIDTRLKFSDGYPLIVVFYRGFYCPRDNVQMRQLVQFQQELRVNFCKMVAISVQPPLVQAAFRAGLGANWPFLSDKKRELIKAINILDETEGEYAYPPQPYTFVLKPDLTVHSIYNGWFYIGRPSLDELRQDLRSIMSEFSNYGYETYTDPHVTQIRIPQQTWLDGAPTLGESGYPVENGRIHTFNVQSGNGTIQNEKGEEIFFNFTAIPGEGYRRLPVGTAVKFERVETETGPVARNVTID